jgi:hypothetical protein
MLNISDVLAKTSAVHAPSAAIRFSTIKRIGLRRRVVFMSLLWLVVFLQAKGSVCIDVVQSCLQHFLLNRFKNLPLKSRETTETNW